VLAGIAHRILVMYGGVIVEEATVDELFYRPAHPYTKALLGSVARPGAGGPVAALAGEPPSGLAPPPGCVFAPRCPHAQALCRMTAPALEDAGAAGQRCACHFAEELR